MLRWIQGHSVSRFCVHGAAVAGCFLFAVIASAAEHHGQVSFNGLPVPGATVTATQAGKHASTVTNAEGVYSFPDLPDGTWKIEVTMTGFAPLQQDIAATVSGPAAKWELKMLPLAEILAQTKTVKLDAPVIAAAEKNAAAKPAAKPAEVAEAPKPAEESAQSSDGFLVNGSVNNAATSQFSLSQAFGNTRKGAKSLYTGGLGLVLDNSALDARPYSISGIDTAKSAYNRLTATATFGGPIRIPHFMPRGPNFFLVYQWKRDSLATAESALVPTLAQRAGAVAGGNVTVRPQAQALLALYPLPNVAGNFNYNYQVPILGHSHEDIVQARLDKSVTRRDQVYGHIGSQSIRMDNANVFGFRDTTQVLGLNTAINWNHRLNHDLFFNVGYQFSRLRTHVTPFFENRTNFSGAAGIIGNNQDPANWGPPTLVFSSGIAALTDAQSAFNRNRTDSVSASAQYYHGRHNMTAGGDFRRQDGNYFFQQNPRGTFTFTGAASGLSDFADFLTGVPDSSAVAFGNADKYLRQSVYDAYATDDWRLRPELTLNIGVRWEYGAPVSELKGWLVNLDIAPGFTSVAPVLGSNPTGPLTGERYPASLLRPYRVGVEPRLGLSWRPIPGSSLVVRAGYGIYDDTSVYQGTALSLAQQAPLSKSLSVQNSPTCPLTLANGFVPCAGVTGNTFAADPNFRVGFAQTWQLAVQRDLPAALQMTATYLGIQGSNGVQEFLPNSYPIGGVNPCPSCPSGFVYRTSNGRSHRESGSLQLRRRLRSGFLASAQYTFSKSTDNDALLGGQGPVAPGAASQNTATPRIAQDWRNLEAEHSLSNFDQRHLFTATLQYTSGMGLGGGTLLGGWRGRALKEWTALTQIVAGTGLPETPVYLAIVPGTGVSGSLRPDRTTASLTPPASGRALNPAAYAAPQPGAWGNAGRNSIEGPGQFTLNASLSRTFRLDKRYNLDVRVDATNLLNHVVFTSWNTTLNPAFTTTSSNVLSSPLFGLPAAANSMRSLQTTARLRF